MFDADAGKRGAVALRAGAQDGAGTELSEEAGARDVERWQSNRRNNDGKISVDEELALELIRWRGESGPAQRARSS